MDDELPYPVPRSQESDEIMKCEDKVASVTGGNFGIGRGTAHRVAREGQNRRHRLTRPAIVFSLIPVALTDTGVTSVSTHQTLA
jgi:hypothetical protein